MGLATGTRLGPYEVIEPLGAGGMGEVYRARDTRLDRTVAVKIVPKEMAADPQRKLRFEREARAISNLNHPNICVLHDIGTDASVDYLVMECLEGDTLASRLEKGALPLEQVLTVGAQIADAIAQAHRAGIVHRDLKPGNIMLTPSGAKLLDFGLARPALPLGTGATITVAAAPVTQEHTVLGTFQYMSPEQVEGKEVDFRSDIFSLGAVLYEMTTGKRAFEGTSQLSVASAILEKDPPAIGTIRQVAPRALDFAVRKCLEKAPGARWQSAADLADHLKWILASLAQDALAVPATTRLRRAWLPWLVSASLALGTVGAALFWPRQERAQDPMYFSLGFPETASDIAIGPDGRTVALVADWEAIRQNVIWIYRRGEVGARSVPGTEGASWPFWSPDGRSLAFFADGRLKRVDLSGGPAQTLCWAPAGRGGAWNQDGIIVFAPTGQLGNGLSRVPASGGTPVVITVPDWARGEQNHRWPVFLPDGKRFLYVATNVSGRTDVDAIYQGSLNSNEKRFVAKATANAAYVPPGYLVFYRDKTLFGQRFDPATLQLSGNPAPLLTDVQYQPRFAKAVFSAADTGLLLAQPGIGTLLARPTWFDRHGKELGTVGRPGGDVYSDPFLSPDGQHLAFSRTDQASLNTDLWTVDLKKGATRHLTFDPAIETMAVWTPGGGELAFSANRGRVFDLYMKRADGGEGERLLLQDDTDKFPNAWSRDGRRLVFMRGVELWMLTVGEGKASPLLRSSGALKNAQLSPDSRWLAYASNETGRWEVYVTSFPAAQGKWQVSADGGEQPKWRGDGRELFYVSLDRKVMAAPVSNGPAFDAGAPSELFAITPAPLVGTSDLVSYDVAADGQRFLVNVQVKPPDSPISVLLNWAGKVGK